MIFFKYRTCLQIFYFIILNIISLNGEDNIQKVQEILNDLPKASDLEDYLLFLDRILDFYMKYKFYIDINSYSTLFIFGASVHQVLKNQRETLPSDLVFRLEKMFNKSKTLCDYYRAYIERGIKEHELEKSDINTAKISYLFHNVSAWIPFEKFNLELLKRTKIYDRDELETMYGPWERYAKSISSVKMCIPSEEQSDSCVGLLARQPTFLSIHTSLAKCNLPPYCRLYVQHGSDFGYGIMHSCILRGDRTRSFFNQFLGKIINDASNSRRLHDG
ncbi:uncharacterized protein LOC118262790 isoform X2 [Spodoptera frugiperda]|uniref:Uncharacterized protein LOC118262790 isoform X2 n=1 Tax=Spodoptera frugiperda TaxID=7108 RepID=A0A9R0DUN4_SPOFR|nr:uncharacterized protein LOC118262790 isoform X2 [Spodoptera frugiperda]